MIIPTLQGKNLQSKFTIYTACDEKYFDLFGASLINSIQKNTSSAIHIHLFNPRGDQLGFCLSKKISYTFEYVDSSMFQKAADVWKSIPLDDVEKSKYERTLNAMSKSDDKHIIDRIQKAYYACARFIRLNQLNLSEVFAIDSDAIVRRNFPYINGNNDIYLHSITGKKARMLAGGLYIPKSTKGLDFLKDYSNILKSYIEKDYLYWGIDQDILPIIAEKYSVGQLPMSYIDWEMRPSSFIWTAKGKRKDLKIFIDEQKKYMS